MKLFTIVGFVILTAGSLYSQELQTRNIIVVTLDGYRWKELFEGADEKIISFQGIQQDSLIRYYTPGSREENRNRLMPFFWNVIAKEGQLYGNRNYNNKVNCKNNYLFSYPGYSEMFVGYPGDISSNKNKLNPNPTVFEYLQRLPQYHDEIAAFATWEAFPFILREKKSGIYVNAGNEPVKGNLSHREKHINHELQQKKRSDEQTFDLAFAYLKRERPKILFISFDGTDHHGHGGRYVQYLQAAADADQKIQQLWEWTQSQPDYKDQTTILVTTDHGRGNGKRWWKHHKLFVPGSRHTWFAVIGPDTPAFGELRFKGKYYQQQLAKTLAAFLGINFKPEKKAGDVIHTMVAAPVPSLQQMTVSKSVFQQGTD